MGKPVALQGAMHVCPMCDPGPKPHVGGPVQSTSQNFVKVNGVPIATVGDKCLCTGVPTTAAITGGSSVAKINGRKVARFGDACEHGGRLIQGENWLRFE
ncbi:hypothetical protein G6N74_23010 [Mesorhizobium sp. CGMCC 1.15528]|uniref:PAAR domain-containing protein n=1 Tax=Mesorhizobium zhangyense TaxID=1776730 RepID=A0A7C9RA12_9HYPH|nr:PAAR domain-containing protein [Mesorhizobium zhangyense]NGN43940.1 hypothetical protein [Mesorhizobium zhangyense]